MSEQSDKFHEETLEKVRKEKADKEELVDRWLKLRDSYEHRPKKFAPVWKGVYIFGNITCPICGSELKTTIVSESRRYFLSGIGMMYDEQRELLTCKKCDYEYAYEERDIMN